ncbi:hypothetical protein DH2020_040205 [Rehmannia glutinosa]|uniref:Integral membrane bound transporter domain-containing protein n=1 Tax=Rehmannia glutinosa TaxID=99300 RepID=A0ABR0UUX6_REHGL
MTVDYASTVADRARIMWCMRLSSALRTALACAIVGGATLYGPRFIVNEIKFAAFSYLTAVLIVSDASLGDTLRGCWHAFCATAQVVPLGMLVRWIIAPTAGVPVSVMAVVVAVVALLVALPECTHLTAKRIAFGQIVLVCTDVVVSGGTTVGVMHPVYVAASTALGALASVLALLVPYPNLACYKVRIGFTIATMACISTPSYTIVHIAPSLWGIASLAMGLSSAAVRKLCRVYADNASQRISIYLRAFTAPDNHTKMELISQAKPLAETGAKLLESIRNLQEGMKWERPWRPYLKPDLVGPGDRLQRMELQMRGMEYSLYSSLSFPIQEIIDQEQLSNVLKGVSIQLEQKIEQVRCFSPFSETKTDSKEKPSLLLQTMFPTLKQGWVLFYFSCIDMLLNDSTDSRVTLKTERAKTEFNIFRTCKSWITKLTNKGRLEFAFKCSLSLSLAVLFGLIFDKENGCWAGLTIAISFVTGRQAVFTIANTRAQGTAIGSVYGVIISFLFHCEELKLLALLPWIIFTSFLRHSKMYGQTGGVSAAIGALLILGRKNYGAPNEFAIARLAEVFVGLSAFIMVELLLQPIRAATLAKNHLCQTMSSLQNCIKETGICSVDKNKIVLKFIELRDKQRNLHSLVGELKRFVVDAELEPDFWYLPFRASSYQKLVGSLSNIADMLYFITYNFEILSELSEHSTECKELHEQMNSELELFQETLSSSQVYLETANSTESLADSRDRMDETFRDLEEGKFQNPDELNVSTSEHKEAERTTKESEDNKRLRETMMQCLGATGFCINSLMKEIDDTKICKLLVTAIISKLIYKQTKTSKRSQIFYLIDRPQNYKQQQHKAPDGLEIGNENSIKFHERTGQSSKLKQIQ